MDCSGHQPQLGASPGMLVESRWEGMVHKLFSQMPDPGTGDILGRVILTLYEVPLPAKDQVLDLFKSSLEFHQVRTVLDLLSADLQSLISGISNSSNMKNSTNRSSDFSKAVQELAESVNTDLPLFECVARHFDSKQPPNTAR